MNDTIQIKALVGSTLTGAQFPGAAIQFDRILSPNRNEANRQSLIKGDLNPTKLRIAHTAATSTAPQRSLLSYKQQFGRVDVGGAVTKIDYIDLRLTAELTSGITAAEKENAVEELFGALSQNDFSLFKEWLATQL